MNRFKFKGLFFIIFMIGVAFTISTINSQTQHSKPQEHTPKQASPKQSNSSNKVSILSWNIQDFGKSKSDATINTIANTVRNYDIVAIQEVVAGYGGSQAVAKLADALNRKGAKWDYAISYPTKSPPYKTEKYAYLWKTSKVSVNKKARLLSEVNPNVFREPYLIGFNVGGKSIELLNYHARKHKDKPQDEISDIIKYLKKNKQTIIMGDFNLSETHPVWNNLYKSNYKSALRNNRTSLKTKCKKGNYLYHSLDNIYYNDNMFSVIEADKVDLVKQCNQLKKVRRISDHLPIYVHINIL
ncbi:MAG: endonuclease [Flavobacteriaceae bacterium]|nr:MAG: endonuclease [Flavobacteriaceae bacterium]